MLGSAMRAVSQSVVIFAALSEGAHAACNEKRAGPVAEQISKDINTLADFTSISCVVADDGSRCGIVCISKLRTPPAQKSPLLATIVGSAGLRTRTAGLANFGMISFMDKGAAETRNAFQISAARASDLQGQVHSGKLSMRDLIATTEKEFREVSIDSTKKR